MPLIARLGDLIPADRKIYRPSAEPSTDSSPRARVKRGTAETFAWRGPSNANKGVTLRRQPRQRAAWLRVGDPQSGCWMTSVVRYLPVAVAEPFPARRAENCFLLPGCRWTRHLQCPARKDSRSQGSWRPSVQSGGRMTWLEAEKPVAVADVGTVAAGRSRSVAISICPVNAERRTDP